MLLHSQKIIEDAINSQESLFKSISNIDLSASFKNEIDWSVFLKQTNEFSSLGYHLNFHPLKNYIRTFEKLNIKLPSTPKHGMPLSSL